MKKVLIVIAAVVLGLALLGTIGRLAGGKKSENTPEQTEQTEQQPKEEEKQEEEKPKEEPAQQIVTEQTRYDVFRCDYREGMFGKPQMVTQNTVDFSQDYADLSPDGSFSFSIQGVSYTTKISLGEKTKHLYSGDQEAEVTQLLFDGKDHAEVRDVYLEGYYVDDYILLDMDTKVDGKNMYMTFYLWKHVDGM